VTDAENDVVSLLLRRHNQRSRLH